MDWQHYFQSLIEKYQLDLPIRLVISTSTLAEPVSMDGEVLFIDGTKNLDYRKVIQEFIVYHMINALEIHHDYLTIKTMSMKDLTSYYEIISNETICYLEASTPVKNKNEALRKLMSARINAKGIYLENKLIGYIGISKDSSRASIGVEIGYSINENYWNRGIGTLAVSLLTDELLKNSPISIVSARTLEENIASQCVLLKSGFNQEGIRKQSLFHPMTKEVISTIVYSKEI